MTPQKLDAARLAEIEARAKKALGVSKPRVSVAGQDRLRFEILTADIPAMAQALREAWGEVERLTPKHEHRFLTDEDGAVHPCSCGKPHRPARFYVGETLRKLR